MGEEEGGMGYEFTSDTQNALTTGEIHLGGVAFAQKRSWQDNIPIIVGGVVVGLMAIALFSSGRKK